MDITSAQHTFVGVTRPVAGQRPARLCGQITTPATMLDVANMLSVAAWSGELHVSNDNAQYCIVLSRGAVTHATSSLRSHRLGELLVRQGRITAAQLSESLDSLGPATRIGESLVERGWVSRGELFEALRRQTTNIVHAAFTLEEGRFMFVDLAPDATPPPISFHLSVQHLLLEGARRLDEMRRFRSRIHDGDLCPTLLHAPAAGAPEAVIAIASQMDGSASIRQLAERVCMDEFDVTKIVFELLEKGQARLQAPARDADATATELAESFNAVLRIIFAAAACYDCAESVHARVSSWLAETSLTDCIGEQLRDDGGVEIGRIAARARAGVGVAFLYHGLHELTTFALFAVGASLPRAVELELAREVSRRLERVAAPSTRA